MRLTSLMPTLLGAAIGVGLSLTVAPGWPLIEARHRGVTAADPRICAAHTSTLTEATWAGRIGRDRLLVPTEFRYAPVDATWCRFDPDDALVSAWQVDSARTAYLVGLLAAPPGGWAEDAFVAKRIVPLDDAQLVALARPDCPGTTITEVLLLRYNEGDPVTTRIRRGPCAATANGVITLQTPPGIEGALDALAN